MANEIWTGVYQPYFSGINYPKMFGWDMPFTLNFGNQTTVTKSEQNEAVLSVEELRERARKEGEFLRARQQDISELNEEINLINQQTASIKKNQLVDGSSVLPADKEVNKTTAGKAMRWLSNAGNALKNIGKTFIGFEQDGSWNWKKCLKNIAIAAGCIGACFIPVVGPFISYGLLATGAIGGTVGIVKGVSDLKKAEQSGNESAIDKAQQNICSNTFIAVTSVLGLKGMGKGFRLSQPSQASSAQEGVGIITKIAEHTSNFAKDITINAFKSAKCTAIADKALLSRTSGNAVTKFFKAWGSKISASFKSYNDYKEKYKEEMNNAKQAVDKKLADVNSKLADTNLTPKDRAMLEQEKLYLELNKADLESIGTTAKTKTDLNKLKEDNNFANMAKKEISEMTPNANGNYTIGNQEFTPKEFKTFKKQISASEARRYKELSKVLKAHENMMRSAAGKLKRPENRAMLDEYLPSDILKHNPVKFYKPLSWFKLTRKNDYLYTIGGKNPWAKDFIYSITSTPETFGYKASAWMNPIYSSYGQNLTEEQVEQVLQELENRERELKNTVDTLNKMDRETYEAYKKELEAQSRQQRTSV